MKLKNYLLITLLFLLLNACSANRYIEKKHIQLTEKLEELRVQNELPGLYCSIVYNNGNSVNLAVGNSDVEHDITNSTKFRLLSGSIGKTYAVALLYQLVDQGKVTLEEKFITYFPNQDWLKRLPNIEDITVEMLLQHTSGLPRWVMKEEVWKVLHEKPDKVWTYQDRFAYIYDEAPVHEAGKGWAYSDTNYLLIGMLIEQIMDQDYYDAVQEKLLTPLKLGNTVPSNKRVIPKLAIGYSELPETFYIPNRTVVDGKYVFNPQVEWTGGGMASTTPDLAKWCKLYFEGSLFSKELLKKTTTINPNGEKVSGIHSYGMGSFIYDTTLGKAYGHSGFMPGFNSIMIYFPEQEIAVALQSNCDYAGKKMSLVAYVKAMMNVMY